MNPVGISLQSPQSGATPRILTLSGSKAFLYFACVKCNSSQVGIIFKPTLDN